MTKKIVGKFPSALSPESRVLLHSARLALDESSRQNLDELLRTELNWDELICRANGQGVTPLLYWHLSKSPAWWRGIPKSACDRLAALYHHNVRRNEMLLSELHELLAMMQEADIPIMLMKELHLLQTIYPEPGLRPLGDLDLLVQREDFERARFLLQEAGYKPELRHNPFKDRYGFGYHLINREKGVWIDLQWNLCQREWAGENESRGKFRPPIQKIWERALPDHLAGRRVWKKSWEDLLLHLCVHAEGHGFGELIQFCDIAAVIQRCGRVLDWKYLIETARAANLDASLYCTLRLVNEMWSVAIPEEVFKQLQPAYRPFEIYQATFGPLVMLYTFLDEAANDPAVSPAASQEWERVTRDTVEQNRRAYEVMDAAMTYLAHAGLAPIALMSREPERTLPHVQLRPLGETAIIVAANACSGVVDKKLEAQFNAIGAETIRFQLRLEPDLLKRFLSRFETPTLSTRQRLKKIFFAARPQSETISIYPLSPEEIFLVLCRRFNRSAAWLDFSAIVEFLRNARNQPNWPVFWDKAQEHGLANAAATSLLCVHELTRLPILAAALAPLEIIPNRLPLSQYAVAVVETLSPPELQDAVQAALRFLALPSWQERRKYFARLTQVSNPESGTISRLVAGVKLFFQWRHAKKLSPAAVYWLEMPRVAEENLSSSPVTAKKIHPEVESYDPAIY